MAFFKPWLGFETPALATPSHAFSAASRWTFPRYSCCLLCQPWKSFCHWANWVLNHLADYGRLWQTGASNWMVKPWLTTWIGNGLSLDFELVIFAEWWARNPPRGLFFLQFSYLALKSRVPRTTPQRNAILNHFGHVHPICLSQNIIY